MLPNFQILVSCNLSDDPYLSKLPLPITGVGLREVPGPQSFRDVPEADVGALGLVKEEVELVRLLLHPLHLVGGQVVQALNLFLESLHALKCQNYDALVDRGFESRCNLRKSASAKWLSKIITIKTMPHISK